MGRGRAPHASWLLLCLVVASSLTVNLAEDTAKPAQAASSPPPDLPAKDPPAAPATPAKDPPAAPAATTTPAKATPTTPAKATPAPKVPATPATVDPVPATPTKAVASVPAATPAKLIKPIVVAAPPPVVFVTPNTTVALPPAITDTPAAQAPGQPPLQVAVRAVIRVIGQGVTPFNPTKQAVLLAALGNMITTVRFSHIRIVMVKGVTSLDTRRTLLATDLANVADVTAEFNAGNLPNVPLVQQEVASLFPSGQLATALQNQGQSQWSVSLQSLTTGQPSSYNFPHICKKPFGRICLDRTALNATGMKAIIALGCVAVCMALAGLLVCWDVRNNSGRAGTCEYVSGSAQTSPIAAGGASPMSAKCRPDAVDVKTVPMQDSIPKGYTSGEPIGSMKPNTFSHK